MKVQSFNQRVLRPGIPLLLIALLIFSGLLAYCGNRSRQNARAMAVLRENKVHFRQDGGDAPRWYARLPLLGSPPPIRSVSLHSQQNLQAIVMALVQLGTVSELSYYRLTPEELTLISTIPSIEAIHASWGGSAEEVRPFLSHKIKDYSVSGADHNIPPDALTLLFSIPTLKRVCTAHGEHAVPPELRAKRPDVTVYLTDFPP